MSTQCGKWASLLLAILVGILSGCSVFQGNLSQSDLKMCDAFVLKFEKAAEKDREQYILRNYHQFGCYRGK